MSWIYSRKLSLSKVTQTWNLSSIFQFGPWNFISASSHASDKGKSDDGADMALFQMADFKDLIVMQNKVQELNCDISGHVGMRLKSSPKFRD